MKKYFILTFLLFSTFSIYADVEVGAQVLEPPESEIQGLSSDIAISEKFLTPEILNNALLNTASTLPEQIRKNYHFYVYFLNVGDIRLGIGQMSSVYNDRESTNLLAVKDKKLIWLHCTTINEKPKWNSGKCAEAIKEVFDIEISDEAINHAQKEVFLPKK